jgi:uncharacterized protein YaaW (UPF0174 family)
MAEYPNFVYEDRDLYDVLAKATDEELGILVGLMLRKLSCSIHGACRDVPAIVNEFQSFGGHTFLTPIRGHGVCYREIVGDVAGKIGADLSGCQNIAELEWRIIERLIDRTMEKLESMDADKKKEILEELKKLGAGYEFHSLKDLLLNQGAYQAVRMIIIQVIVREFLLKLGIRQAATWAGGRLVTILAGPIGWALGGVWAVIDIAGPAYSVTVPGVLLVAVIRMRLAAEETARYIGG